MHRALCSIEETQARLRGWTYPVSVVLWTHIMAFFTYGSTVETPMGEAGNGQCCPHAVL
jgi:hypothetical protein